MPEMSQPNTCAEHAACFSHSDRVTGVLGFCLSLVIFVQGTTVAIQTRERRGPDLKERGAKQWFH
jgi:hypothetical protein